MSTSLHTDKDTPFKINLSFYKIIDGLEKIAADPSDKMFNSAQALLQKIALFPALKEGITSEEEVVEHAELIRELLNDYFSPVLTKNEIKAINIPYTNIFFNYSERFRNILNAAGPGFQVYIRDFSEHQLYVMSCCIILNEFYGTRLNFSSPLFYDIPTAGGILKHYRILYNADFLDIFPTERSIAITQDDIDELINNYEDLNVWKKKFPVESWTLKGFSIITLFDATVENAVSIFKEKLLGLNPVGLQESMESIFSSIYNIPDIQVGFAFYHSDTGQFRKETFVKRMRSFIINDHTQKDAEELLSIDVYKKLIKDKVYFTVADTVSFINDNPAINFVQTIQSKNVRSFILAPIVKNDRVLGILEICSARPKELNSINANKLDVVLSYLTDTVERLLSEYENQLQAVIQETFTSVQPNVNWKFQDEAKKIIQSRDLGETYELNDIIFRNVYPFYGQIDIKGSSEARNLSLQNDLQNILNALFAVFKILPNATPKIKSYKEKYEQLEAFTGLLATPIKAGTEQYINTYLDHHIYPSLKKITTPSLLPVITNYFKETDRKTGSFHTYRRMYETTISSINNKMTHILDFRQKEAQAVFPHYFERFKTDGVEHNLYVGASISPNQTFALEHLHQLRLWQLKVLCEMEIAHHKLKTKLPYPLEVTTLVLVYTTTITIRFRTDEKRFDVDGSYNARFEIIKKRIDKAHIKDTDERITKEQKLTIVYTNDAEEKEYLHYIKTLQSLNLLDKKIEKFEVEDLQDISGLMAYRVGIINKD